MMKLIALLFPFLIVPYLTAAERPNIILINIDDLGYGDIGPFGSTKNKTPQLDRMAKEGRLLKSHYAAPVCSPSRASLLTGCYPKRVLPIPHVLFPASKTGLHPDEITIAELLRQAGYATGCIGKWHLGDQPDFLPTRQGFDYYFGLPYSNDMGPTEDGSKTNPDQQRAEPKAGQPSETGKSASKNNGKNNGKNKANTTPERQKAAGSDKARSAEAVDDDGVRGAGQPPLPLLENEKVIARVRSEEQTTLTEQYVTKAEQFIGQHADKSFFLYLPHTAVHFPLYPGMEFRGKSGNGLYGDWVQEVDWAVGKVLDSVRAHKLEQKTLVIFTSDNGGAGNHGAINFPLRGHKGTTLEGGIRVPTIAWWPGKIPADTSTSEMTTTMDFLPMFAELARMTTPKDRTIDGLNIWPALISDAPGPRTEFLYFRGLKLQAVRQGPWKLHLEKSELYNLETDIGEANNIAATETEMVGKLTALAVSVDTDLGRDGVGPGCRPLGRVDHVEPLINADGVIRSGFAP